MTKDSRAHFDLLLAIEHVCASVRFHEGHSGGHPYESIVADVRERADDYLTDPRYTFTEKYFKTVRDASTDDLAVVMLAKERDEWP